MSLLKRRQERDQKVAAAAARLAKAQKLKELAIHPLAKGGCSRDVRDAYFQGLVFAAIADDDRIDKSERTLLSEIGASLGISSAEIVETIQSVQALDDEGKFALVEACVSMLKGNEIGVKLFYAQFIQVWTSHECNEKELSVFLKDFAARTGVALPDTKRLDIRKVIQSDNATDVSLDALAGWMGDEPLKYFVVKRYGDVSDILAMVRRRRKEAEEKRNREKAAARENARQQLDAVIKEVVRTYGDRASTSLEAFEHISELVEGIDGDLIDWSSYVNALLRGAVVEKRRLCLNLGEYAIVSVRKCRNKIWRLVTLLMLDYLPKYSSMWGDLDWLLSSRGIECDCWKERLEGFVDEYLHERVTLS